METLLNDGTWLAGDAKSIADISVSCQLDLLMKTQEVAQRMSRYPNLIAWLARCA
ncbi:glutathione binding-like protein [Paraburkholderia kirstenboschensis]|uniref:glutathione binding-like protein n=1 Tax=Paraburkholderia kirstenboschensis TaxID=1245436 RepID=UPI0037421F8E